ncbi:HDIG domain-containing metalloprotein [Candidatus Chlorohelix sp.]|uniref:CCA tRNA nucleotidyltransferase n=1 Tax=Candidatus Chlorohelix sp. TaxID=3139201 RepID=UPI00306D7E03
MCNPLSKPQKAALEIAAKLFDSDSLWLVGGWVRDALLSRPADDVDLAVSGTPAEALAMARRFSNAIQAHLSGWQISYFPLDTENGVARIVFKSGDEHFYFDFAALQQNDITADLLRRDFTLNALAIALPDFLEHGLEATVIDLCGGLADIKARLIRPIREANIISDPLRMLRGIRLKAQLSSSGVDWQLTADALEIFRRNAPLIKQSAGERCATELNKILLAGGVIESLRLLDSCGLLSLLIPELGEGKGNIQMNAHYYDVWNHSLVTVDRVEWLVRPNYRGQSADEMIMAERPENYIAHWSEILAQLHGREQERFLWLLWSALLHDVGKPRTRNVDSDGEIHFYHHAQVGAQMARTILERFHFSRQMVEGITTMVDNHMRIGMLKANYDVKSGSGVSNRAIFRFLKDTNPVQIEMMPLSLADHAAVVGPRIAQARQLKSWNHHLHFTDRLSRKYLGPVEEKLVDKPRLLDGHSLMQELKLTPGPQLGKILREIEESQAVGEISTTEEALELARRLLNG